MENNQQEKENQNVSRKRKIKLKKKTVVILLSIVVIGIIFIIMAITGTFRKEEPKEDTIKEIKTITKDYIAYIKINPSIKLEYSIVCKSNQCEEPIIKNYELVNEDAKELLKDINLLENETSLVSILESIGNEVHQKGIEFDTIEIYSDWNKIENYLADKVNTTKWLYKTNYLNTKQIDEKLKSDIAEEEKIKKEKEEEEKKTKEEELAKENSEKEKVEKENKEKSKVDSKDKETTSSSTNNNEKSTADTSTDTKANRDSTVIYLSDGVSYYQSGGAYCCVECFSDDLIYELRNAKGYLVNIADSSTLDFIKISQLSSPYNSSVYFGVDLVSKIEAAGGENCAGLGGGPEPLTAEICSQYHLTCE